MDEMIDSVESTIMDVVLRPIVEEIGTNVAVKETDEDVWVHALMGLGAVWRGVNEGEGRRLHFLNGGE